jgi:hypothetical protein
MSNDDPSKTGPSFTASGNISGAFATGDRSRAEVNIQNISNVVAAKESEEFFAGCLVGILILLGLVIYGIYYGYESLTGWRGADGHTAKEEAAILEAAYIAVCRYDVQTRPGGRTDFYVSMAIATTWGKPKPEVPELMLSLYNEGASIRSYRLGAPNEFIPVPVDVDVRKHTFVASAGWVETNTPPFTAMRVGFEPDYRLVGPKAVYCNLDESIRWMWPKD